LPHLSHYYEYHRWLARGFNTPRGDADLRLELARGDARPPLLSIPDATKPGQSPADAARLRVAQCDFHRWGRFVAHCVAEGARGACLGCGGEEVSRPLGGFWRGKRRARESDGCAGGPAADGC